ncbi:MAG: hypothetical protein B6U94_01390 [Thermofilum sp. ex4484_79]|nr:MAG: hypothetical protein B6U94_01390 [Thermofilum sp. ex4484_79]
MRKESEIRIRQIFGIFVIVLTLLSVYAMYQVIRYILNMVKGSLDFYTFHMQLLVISTFTLSLSYILYETYMKTKRS